MRSVLVAAHTNIIYNHHKMGVKEQGTGIPDKGLHQNCGHTAPNSEKWRVKFSLIFITTQQNKNDSINTLSMQVQLSTFMKCIAFKHHGQQLRS